MLKIKEKLNSNIIVVLVCAFAVFVSAIIGVSSLGLGLNSAYAATGVFNDVDSHTSISGSGADTIVSIYEISPFKPGRSMSTVTVIYGNGSVSDARDRFDPQRAKTVTVDPSSFNLYFYVVEEDIPNTAFVHCLKFRIGQFFADNKILPFHPHGRMSFRLTLENLVCGSYTGSYFTGFHALDMVSLYGTDLLEFERGKPTAYAFQTLFNESTGFLEMHLGNANLCLDYLRLSYSSNCKTNYHVNDFVNLTDSSLKDYISSINGVIYFDLTTWYRKYNAPGFEKDTPFTVHLCFTTKVSEAVFYNSTAVVRVEISQKLKISYYLDGSVSHFDYVEMNSNFTPHTLSTGALDNRVFLGWYDNPEFTGLAVDNFHCVASSMRFYAKLSYSSANVFLRVEDRYIAKFECALSNIVSIRFYVSEYHFGNTPGREIVLGSRDYEALLLKHVVKDINIAGQSDKEFVYDKEVGVVYVNLREYLGEVCKSAPFDIIDDFPNTIFFEVQTALASNPSAITSCFSKAVDCRGSYIYEGACDTDYQMELCEYERRNPPDMPIAVGDNGLVGFYVPFKSFADIRNLYISVGPVGGSATQYASILAYSTSLWVRPVFETYYPYEIIRPGHYYDFESYLLNKSYVNITFGDVTTYISFNLDAFLFDNNYSVFFGLSETTDYTVTYSYDTVESYTNAFGEVCPNRYYSNEQMASSNQRYYKIKPFRVSELPPVAAKEGYTFQNYYKDYNYVNVLAPSAKVTANITIYPRYIPNEYNVNFYNGDVLVATQKRLYQNNFNIPIVEKEGHTLAYWSYKDLSNNDVDVYAAACDVNAYANFRINRYTFIVRYNGSPYYICSYDYNTAFTIDSLHLREFPTVGIGTHFSGWSLSVSGGEFSSIASSDQIVMSDNILVTGFPIINDDVTPGYTFLGWYYDSEYTLPYKVGDVVSADVSVWRKSVLNTYTVYKYFNFDLLSTESCDYGVSVPLDPVVRDGYTFNGWKYNDYILTSGFLQPASDLILQADYSINTFDVVKLLDGVEFSREKIDYNTSYSFDTPKNLSPRLKFVGWFDNAAFSGEMVSNKTIVDNVTVYGKTAPNMLVVSYYVGKDLFKTSELLYGSFLVIPQEFNDLDIYTTKKLDNKIDKASYVVKENVNFYISSKDFKVDKPPLIDKVKLEAFFKVNWVWFAVGGVLLVSIIGIAVLTARRR